MEELDPAVLFQASWAGWVGVWEVDTLPCHQCCTCCCGTGAAAARGLQGAGAVRGTSWECSLTLARTQVDPSCRCGSEHRHTPL